MVVGDGAWFSNVSLLELNMVKRTESCRLCLVFAASMSTVRLVLRLSALVLLKGPMAGR